MAFVYSCCFWFSLRLGGILIAILSCAQAISFIVICSIAYNEPRYVNDQINTWVNSLNLIYVKHYLEQIQANSEKYTSYCITFLSIYIVACLLYMYGAYMFKNALMVAYIVLELVRLLVLLAGMVTWLLVLKENTMDIGLLIGASVLGGFGLLGLFYLWVCAANLPIVINEMEREEKLATINKLERMLENARSKFGNRHLYDDFDDEGYTGLFVVPRSRVSHLPAINGIEQSHYTLRFMH